MLMPAVLAQSPNEFETPERCAVLEMLNTPKDAAVSLARARVPVGITTAWHSLTGVDERYVILSGQGLVEVGREAPTRVAAGDAVLIPRGCRQRIANIGSTDLVFLCVCTPRFEPTCYVADGD